jgi:hypothetical protein
MWSATIAKSAEQVNAHIAPRAAIRGSHQSD